MKRRLTIAATAMAVMTASVVAAAPAQAAGGVVLYRVVYNSPGADTGSNRSINGEYVVLKNTSSTTRTITGWTLRDRSGHRYTMPTTRIAAGKYLYVRTGRGTNTTTTRYWGSRYYIWNNSGDTAYLRTRTGALVDSCAWKSSGSARYC